ncbi:50S ribosomal protein L23 [Frateuria sp.]|jgi:large subunit ribosomal protein L23|uniref:50S ribosomal protein L23 n=1 Tax=Frateuria sp. TaxID=2211372 RepID=UPI003F7F1C9D
MSKFTNYDIIRSPVVTEKSTLASEHGQVVFDVAIEATKADIKAAVEGLFSVKVKAVNTLVRKGKTKRFRGFKGVRNDVKKAIVTLVDGQSIDISTGV